MPDLPLYAQSDLRLDELHSSSPSGGMSNVAVPFQPHPLFRGGHLQTLAGFFLFREKYDERARRHIIALVDGDQIVVHEDCPTSWHAGDRAALLIHGLGGCHASPYMQRIARKLNERGVRTFRMDLRGCGAGETLARLPYHSGRSEDASAALNRVADLCPGSPLALVGFSLGGNITLKLLGEGRHAVPPQLDRAAAVSPPIDLQHCVQSLRSGMTNLYDRYFVRLILQQLTARRALVPDAALVDFTTRPRGMAELDAAFTAPVCGFGTAENYYRSCSSKQFLNQIRIPTLILTAEDDPLVPSGPWLQASVSSDVQLVLTRHGGHLGFIARKNDHDVDCRWMDWRIVDWVAGVSANSH